VTLTFDAASLNANSFEVMPYWTLIWSFVKIVWEIKSLEQWQTFKKNSYSDLDLWRSIMKRELVRGLAILNTCVKFRQNRSINKVARDKIKTRQNHTYIHTYVRTYIRARTYIPRTTFLLEGIIRHIYIKILRHLFNLCVNECPNSAHLFTFTNMPSRAMTSYRKLHIL
jgi:hypothetical protein